MSDQTGRGLAGQIVEKLRADGFAAYVVGGCVRDLLLGREPKDWDVATSATPEQVLTRFPGSRLVGAAFGVVLVRAGEVQVEVATFRSESGYTDHRHPDHVAFESDPRLDTARRDFTINALMMDPVSGEVLDFHRGQDDLRAGIIRAVGEPDRRFDEDHLRMLRAVRFAARFGFRIEDGTLAAIQRHATQIGSVSAERIRDELSRILTEGGARRGFELLDATGLLPVILPEIQALQGVEQPPEFHPEGDVWVHTLLMLEKMERPTLTLALGVLLHDVAKPPTFTVSDRIRFNGHAELGARMAVEILSRFRYSSEEIAQVEALVAFHLKFKDVPQMRPSTLKRFLRLDRFEEHLELHRLDCESSHRLLGNYDFVRRVLAETPVEALRPPRLIGGDDLLAAGYTPGPIFREILEDVETAQLEGRLQTAEAAKEYVAVKFPLTAAT